MLLIGGAPADPEQLARELSPGGPERDILTILGESGETYRYPSPEALRFELELRREIIRAAEALHRSGMAFETFRDSRCNEAFWTRGADGGFALKPGVRPSDAVRDIFQNGPAYGTECATAMMAVYHGALLAVFGAEEFDRLFPEIYLMNWHRIDPRLRQVGVPRRQADYLPGDRRYFMNPDVDPETPEWQGENVIDLGGGKYYGHGVGRHGADFFIRALNGNRKEGAQREAYLMNSAARPDFARLFTLYHRTAGQREAALPRGA